MNVQELREQRTNIVADLRAITEKAGEEKRDLSDKEIESFDALKSKVKSTEAQLQRAEFIADTERRASGETISGKTDFELGNYSLLNAIRSQIPGMSGDFGREREVSQELENRSGQKAKGIRVPFEALNVEKRVATTAGDAGFLVGTDHRGDMAISALYPQSIVFALGAQPLTGLRGDISIPRQDTTAPASAWVAENAALTAADHSFDQVTGTPRHVGALSEFSRNLMLQSDPTVENFVRSDFTAKLGAAVDAGVLNGSGAGAEPQGIIGATGVSTLAATTTPTYPEILTAVENVAIANGLSGSLGWALHPGVVRLLRSTLKESGDAGAGYLMETPTQLAGYQAQISTNLPADGGGGDDSTAIFGDFSSIIVAMWGDGGIDLLVNPYESTAYSKGNVQVRAFMSVDVLIRNPAKFCTITGIDVS